MKKIIVCIWSILFLMLQSINIVNAFDITYQNDTGELLNIHIYAGSNFREPNNIKHIYPLVSEPINISFTRSGLSAYQGYTLHEEGNDTPYTNLSPDYQRCLDDLLKNSKHITTIFTSKSDSVYNIRTFNENNSSCYGQLLNTEAYISSDAFSFLIDIIATATTVIAFIVPIMSAVAENTDAFAFADSGVEEVGMKVTVAGQTSEEIPIGNTVGFNPSQEGSPLSLVENGKFAFELNQKKGNFFMKMTAQNYDQTQSEFIEFSNFIEGDIGKGKIEKLVVERNKFIKADITTPAEDSRLTDRTITRPGHERIRFIYNNKSSVVYEYEGDDNLFKKAFLTQGTNGYYRIKVFPETFQVKTYNTVSTLSDRKDMLKAVKRIKTVYNNPEVPRYKLFPDAVSSNCQKFTCTIIDSLMEKK